MKSIQARWKTFREKGSLVTYTAWREWYVEYKGISNPWFLELSISLLEPKSFLFRTSSIPINTIVSSRTNFCFPWRFEKLEFHYISKFSAFTVRECVVSRLCQVLHLLLTQVCLCSHMPAVIYPQQPTISWSEWLLPFNLHKGHNYRLPSQKNSFKLAN